MRNAHRVGAANSIAPSVEDRGALGSVISGTATGKETATSAAAASALAGFVHDGERFEPHTYETTFRFRGDYTCVALAEATATLWCANERTGTLDLYSCVTGQFVAALQTLAAEVAARQAELAELPVKTSAAGAAKSGQVSATPRSRGLVSLSAGGAVASPAARRRSSAALLAPSEDVKPTALRSTTAHVWVGYSDGTVGVYDALLLKLLTTGNFHAGAVTALTALGSGQVVSASADGLLVLWDTEAAGFEAVTRVTVLLDAVRSGAGRLCAMVPCTHASRVCCGFESGEVYSVFLASRPQEQTPAHVLKAHTAKVNDMAVVKELLFTAAEDGSVCVWYCGNPLGAALGGPSASLDARGGIHFDAVTVRAMHAAMKLVRRVAVKPSVRGLLAEAQTRSVWVAYADGLLERWSANPDDDFGVEEVVDNALIAKASTDAASAAAAAPDVTVKSLLSLSAVQTMQWLALSSNGVNKVWYAHKNTLEMRLANSLIALNDVIAQDTEDAAAWREKANVLRQKEMERRERYICILEQLNEQRVLQRYYARWRQSVQFCGAQRRCTTALAATLATRAQVQLMRRFFGKWASFYDGQQRHMRGYVLSLALSRATERQQLHSCFVAWQSLLVQRRVRRTAGVSAAVLQDMVKVALVGDFFHRWRSAVSRNAQRKRGVSAEHLSLLAHKAQRQVLQRVFRQWMSHHESATSGVGAAAVAGASESTTSALSRFAQHYAQLQQQRHARQVLQLWRRWTAKKGRYASLAAVAALREQQVLYETRQSFFLRWRQRVHARHTDENAEQLSALAERLRRAEAEHGDIFEKLQLQKQLDVLLSRQANEEAQLAHTKSQLAALEQSCAQLRAQQHERHRNPTSVADTPLTLQPAPRATVAGAAHAADRLVHNAGGPARASLPGFDLPVSATSGHSASLSAGGPHFDVVGRGHMSANALFYRSLVDQQRLSPIVLAHMPLDEAVHHVMGQLKGNVVNLFTDLPLFRQVKDRRRAGTSAVGILLEAYGEMKRMIVSTVRGASASAASAAVRSGLKATRWPLSMEALDCIPVHQCANVLSAIKTIVVAYDLLQPEDVPGVQSTCEELVANADWVFLIARACYLRRKPLPPANNRQVV